jgi:hypothetical protein
MKNILMFAVLLLLFFNAPAFSQIAINSTGASADPSSILDVNSADKGLLIPRVIINSLTDNVLPVNNPATGLIVFNTGGTEEQGIYIWNGMTWSSLATLSQVHEALPPAGGSGIFGEMFEYNNIGLSSSVTIPSSGTYVQWASASQGDVNGMTFGSSSLIIDNSGMYSIAFNSVVQLTMGGKIVDAAIYVNGNRKDDMHGRAWFKEGGKDQNIAFSGMMRLEAGDSVSVRYTMNDNGVIKVEIANLNLTKVD